MRSVRRPGRGASRRSSRCAASTRRSTDRGGGRPRADRGALHLTSTCVRIVQVRWDHLKSDAQPVPLALAGGVRRTFDTPGFAGMTFYEIQAKSIINRVPGQSRVPFEWTINPYRGCTHACTYCFARNTHTYL